MTKILICLLGFPLNAADPFKYSLHALNRLRQARIKTVVALETAKERKLDDLITLLKDEVEAIAAINRARSLLPAEKFDSIFRLCKYSSTPMTKDKYEQSLVNLPVTKAALELLLSLKKNMTPTIYLDIAQEELRKMISNVDSAKSINKKIAIQGSYEVKRMQEMTQNLMKGIKYLASSGGVLWVADIRRHHVSRLSAYLRQYLAQNPIPNCEIEILSGRTLINSHEEGLIQQLTEQEFTKWDQKSLNEFYQTEGEFDLIIEGSESTKYSCQTLDAAIENFIISHNLSRMAAVNNVEQNETINEMVNEMSKDKIKSNKRIRSLSEFKCEKALERLMFDLQHINFSAMNQEEFDAEIKESNNFQPSTLDLSLVPSSLMSWVELKRWCKEQTGLMQVRDQVRDRRN